MAKPKMGHQFGVQWSFSRCGNIANVVEDTRQHDDHVSCATAHMLCGAKPCVEESL